MADATVRLCLWSGPRNISTATMRSFEARGGCAVWDEPYYGWFLARTGADHPGRAETLAAWPTDADAIAAACAGPAPGGEPEFFQKHMCQHMLPELDLSWTAACRHLFLIRDPAEVAASYYATRETASPDDLGAERQLTLYDEIAAITGRDWPVVEGRDVLADPAAMLERVCGALDIPWRESMLSWPAGRRATDGPWAPYWYRRVEASTGFAAPQPSPHALPAELEPVVAACRPAYLEMRERKLTPAEAD
ncbi:sulfotransferase family protein [Marinicauda salina]|uniref:Sulfotransferase family protein n=1 Tax=Marinicauda salina TaxID=2135793 RepID=A0A2U2BUG4_9PROT|nr:sulfotransferase family protein [Marinicauda salina]PWE17676.1 sulfotransferase family protein [Marinicauda salina]